jgi:hypothetical protein
MALSRPFTRPLTTITATEASSQSAAITEGATFWYIDITATVNSQLRLLSRIKVTPTTQGRFQSYQVKLLDFTGDAAATFTAGQVTTPFTENEADSIVDIGTSTGVDLHALYTIAGDVTAS